MIIQLIASFPHLVVENVLEDYELNDDLYYRPSGRKLIVPDGATAEQVVEWDNQGRNVLILGDLPVGLTPEFISDEVLVIDEDDIPGANLSVMITEALAL